MNNEKLQLPDGFVFVHKFLLGKPAALLMQQEAVDTTDGVYAVGPGETFEEAEQECLRRYYSYERVDDE